jgi:hypothetical protein
MSWSSDFLISFISSGSFLHFRELFNRVSERKKAAVRLVDFYRYSIPGRFLLVQEISRKEEGGSV